MMELDTQPESSAPPMKCISHLHVILFPLYLKIYAIEKNVIKVFQKLAFHVQVTKDRSIRAQHFIIKKNQTLEHCPGLV